MVTQLVMGRADAGRRPQEEPKLAAWSHYERVVNRGGVMSLGGRV